MFQLIYFKKVSHSISSLLKHLVGGLGKCLQMVALHGGDFTWIVTLIHVYAGGADSVTPFSGSGNISPNLIGQWVGSNVTRSFSFDSSKSYFIGGADQFNDNNFRSFCAVLVKGTIIPIITNGYFNPSVSGNTCNIWIPSSGSTISLYVVQLNWISI